MDIKDFIIVFSLFYLILVAIPSVIFLSKINYKKSNKIIILFFNIIIVLFICITVLLYNLFNKEDNKESLKYYNKEENIIDYYIEKDINPLLKESDVK
ncbi:hypothetical protein CPT_Machias_116 [Staphylococcus phage Machias]|nr:hypothetical protein CPT_Machias_116 [Staphylococcus phage Machias]